MRNSMRCLASVATAFGLLVFIAGCGQRHKGHGHGEDDHGHAHERGQFSIADAGKHHATLTAHRSKEGNELDLAFETQDEKDPQPVALPLEGFTAEAMTPDGQRHELKFEPAPASERPKGEKPGSCSKFNAKAPFLKPSEKIEVVAKIKIDGKDVTVRWKDFDAQKYGHDAD